jgi:hypothetical protein
MQAIWAMKSLFIPRQPEIISIGQTLVSLYSKVDLSMTNAEKALALHWHSNTMRPRLCLLILISVHILTLIERLNLMLKAKSSLVD